MLTPKAPEEAHFFTQDIEFNIDGGGARRDRTDDLNTASVMQCLALGYLQAIWFRPMVPKPSS